MSDVADGDFEFERKFFLHAVPPEAHREPHPAAIVQSYFLAAEGYAVRIRLQAAALPPELAQPCRDEHELLEMWAEQFDFCAMSAKGPYIGGTRYEAERELDVAAGLAMVRLGGDLVAKLRHSLWLGTDGWVIDEFAGANAPLVIAEVERGGPVVDLAIPYFCYSEVSDDARFANDSLAKRPFTHFSAEYAEELTQHGPGYLASFGHNEVGTGF